MNKFIFSLLGLFLFYGMSGREVQAQSNAHASVYVKINAISNTSQIQYLNGFYLNSITSNNGSGNSLILPTVNGKLMNSEIQNLASFSITDSNKNTFTISLPSHPIILENSKNGNTIQLNGTQTSIQSEKGELQKSVRVVNLGGLLKMGSETSDPSGVYTGTYPVTFVYN